MCKKVLFLMCIALVVSAGTAMADKAILSPKGDTVIGAVLAFDAGDVIQFNPVNDGAAILVSGDIFGGAAVDIDSVDMLPDGDLVISTTTAVTLDGQDFLPKDMIKYNPATGVASLLWRCPTTIGLADIDVLANGHFILATTTNGSIGGVTVTKGDVVDYNPATNKAVRILHSTAKKVFLADENVDAVDMLPNGNLLISMDSAGQMYVGGLQFTAGDLVEYNLTTKVSSIYKAEADIFQGPTNLDAVDILPSGEILLSTKAAGMIGDAVLVKKGDLVEYDIAIDYAELVFDSGTTGIDIDCADILGSGNLVLSTVGDNAVIDGGTFKDEDLVEYNPITETASLYPRPPLKGPVLHIIDLSILANGHIVLATNASGSFGGITIGKGDLLDYNPATDKAVRIINSAAGITFVDNEDIDAVHVLSNGNIIFSTASAGKIKSSGLQFTAGDLVEYNPTTKAASIYLAEADVFAVGTDIDAVYIIED